MLQDSVKHLAIYGNIIFLLAKMHEVLRSLT